jgi:hypothetical protein
MGFVGMAIVVNLITWGFTWKVDVDTRKSQSTTNYIR